jgi:hypothetical protein
MAEIIVTYVISYPGTNLVKIGQAKYFVDRFAQLKTGSPVDPEVLCVFRGSKRERDFQKKFGHLRHHGEFCPYTSELKAYIFSQALAEHRLTRAGAEVLSPRIERNAERLRREKRDAIAEAKAAGLEPSLETDD